MNSDGRRTVWFVTVGLVLGAALSVSIFMLGDNDGDSAVVTTFPGIESLSDAVAAGDIDQARTLLESGNGPDEPRVNGFTPLMRAVIRDDVPMVRLLLEAGASLETPGLEGWTVAHVAAQADAADAINELIKAGADLHSRSTNGMNTLDHAASAGSANAIATVAATGVNLNAPSEIVTQGHGYPIDTGSTPLAIAARAGHLAAVERLLALGADVDARSTAGHTPLLTALFAGQPPAVVGALLDAGADPTVRAACLRRCTYEEGDALTWAQRLGDPDVIPLLQSAIAARSN